VSLFEHIRNARLFDLGQPYFVGMPHFPTHPPFLFSLTKKHGDIMGADGVSSAADGIALGTHVGTHIDALCHFSCGGHLYGGVDVLSNQGYGTGINELSVDTVQPILKRGIMLDIAAGEGATALPADFAITPHHLENAAAEQNVDVRSGDIVLLRTGWAAFWNDPVRYITGGGGVSVRGPGPQREAAEWLSQRGIFAAGSDTIAFEKVPSAMPVHVHLLVESGIHIIEALNLDQLSQERIYEFLFVALPLKITGATGSPIRPIAIV
jgi:kynurenine formamidase